MSSKLSSSNVPPKSGHSTGKSNASTVESFRVFPSSPEQEIVISGVAGRYPNCDHAEDLRYHLYNKVRCPTYFGFPLVQKKRERLLVNLSA